VVLIEFVTTTLAVPNKSILLTLFSIYFHDEANSTCRPSGRMRNPGRKKKNFPLFYGNISVYAVFYYFKDDIAFQLVKKLFGFIVMVILSAVGAAHYHHNKIVIAFVYLLVSNRWFQQMPVLINPAFEIKGCFYAHDVFI
jgi:hypothetical protein